MEKFIKSTRQIGKRDYFSLFLVIVTLIPIVIGTIWYFIFLWDLFSGIEKAVIIAIEGVLK